MNLTSTLKFQAQPMIKSKNSKLKLSKEKDENNSNVKKKKFDRKVIKKVDFD